MSENSNGQQNNQNHLTGDLLGDITGKSNYNDLRKAVSEGVQDALKLDSKNNPQKFSQSAFRDKQDEMTRDRNSRVKAAKDYKRHGNIFDDFEQGLKDGFKDVFAGGDFKKSVNAALSEFTKQFGFELEDLPHQLGKEMGSQFANTKLGKGISNILQKSITKMVDKSFSSSDINEKAAKDAINSVLGTLFNRGGGSSSSSGGNIASTVADAAGQAMSNAASNGASNVASSAASNVASTAASGAANAAASVKFDVIDLCNSLQSFHKARGNRLGISGFNSPR